MLDTECPICIEPIDENALFCERCLNGFHGNCLNTWFTQSRKQECPTCRATPWITLSYTEASARSSSKDVVIRTRDKIKRRKLWLRAWLNNAKMECMLLNKLIASDFKNIFTLVFTDILCPKITSMQEGLGHHHHNLPWSPPGAFIASGSRDITVRIGGANRPSNDIWTRGKFISSGSCGRTVRIWDAKRGTLVHTLNRSSNDIWSPRRKFIASGSLDKTVRTWDAAEKLTFFREINQLLNALRTNVSVIILDLSDMQLNSDNILALCELLSVNKHIISVNLSNVNISEKGALEIAKCVMNNDKLLYLDLANTGLNNTGARCLYEGLKKNKTLTYFNVEGNEISSTLKGKFCDFIARNQQLKKPIKNMEIPKEFICPITRRIMDYPTLIDSGITCESEAIRKWLQKKITCPVTGRLLRSKTLKPNHILRSFMATWKEEMAKLKKEQQIKPKKKP